MDSAFAKPSARALFFGLVVLAAIAAFSMNSTPAWAAHSYSNSGSLTYTKNGSSHTDEYTDLEDLFDDADDLDVDVTIDMHGDWNTEDMRIVVPSGRNYTLNMHGHVLDRHLAATDSDDLYNGKSKGDVICLRKNAKLTVNGGNEKEQKTAHMGEWVSSLFWKFDPDHGSQYEWGALITGGAGVGAGGILLDGNYSTLELNDVTVVGNTSDTSFFATGYNITGDGGGVTLQGAESKLIMNHSEISENHSERDGAGVAVTGKSCSISLKNGSLIDSNRAAGDGGGVALSERWAKITLESDSRANRCLIFNNTAEDDGGGIYINKSDAEVSIDGADSQISSNHAKDNGGGIFVDASSTEITIDKGKIDGNYADEGGGIYHNASGGYVYLKNGGAISGNSAEDGNGGGIYSYYNGTEINLNNGSISGNTSEGDGGGLYLNDCAEVHLTNGSKIEGNEAQIEYPSGYTTPSCDGGGIYVNDDDTTITLNNSSISKNSVQYGSGGGIYHNAKNGVVELKNHSSISENTASEDGGGVYNCYNGTSYTLSESTIEGNTASEDGGGLYLNDVATIHAESNSAIQNNKASNGGGIYVDDDGCTIELADSQIKGNSVSGNGGGIYNNDSSTKIELSETSGINSNTAKGNGGALYSLNQLNLNSSSQSGLRWNSATNGAGIWFEKNLTLNGITVSQNEASGNGGGVYCNETTSSNSFKLCGSIKISGNTAGDDGANSNLYLKGDKHIVGGVNDEALATSSKIGISVEGFSTGEHLLSSNGNIVTNLGEQATSVFSSDKPEYSISVKDSKLYLVGTPVEPLLTCYGASDEPIRSENVAYGTEVELKTQDYQDSGLDPDWWTLSSGDGSTRLYPENGTASFTMPESSATVRAHYPDSKTLTLEYGNNETKTLKYVAGSEVKFVTSDYANEEGENPTWWELKTSDGTTKIYTSNNTVLTMPTEDATLSAHYPAALSSLNMTIGEDSSWDALSTAETSGKYGEYLANAPVTKLKMEDVEGSTIEPSAEWIEYDAGTTKQEVTEVKDDSGNVIQKKVSYVVRIENFLTYYYGIKLTGDASSIQAAIEVASSSLGTPTVDNVTTSFETSRNSSSDVDLIIGFTASYDCPDDGSYTVKVNGRDINDSKTQVTSVGHSVEAGQSLTVKAPSVSGWEFVGWENLPKDASEDESTHAVTLSEVAESLELEANYQPVVSKLKLEVAAPTIGGKFPSELASASIVAGATIAADGSRTDKNQSVINDANNEVSFTWQKADKSDAGDVVEGDTTYKGSICMKLPGSGWQFTWDSSVVATINGVAANSVEVDKTDKTITVSWLAKTGPDKRYDSVTTDLADVSIDQASDCRSYLPSSINYKLKDDESCTAEATWGTSVLDGIIASNSFTVTGTFKDKYDAEHKISRTFKLPKIGAPKTKLNSSSEQMQLVELLANSSWGNAAKVQIFYALAKPGAADPADSDYLEYSNSESSSEPQPIKITESCSLYAYALVDNRKTEVAKYSYSLGGEHSITLTGGEDEEGINKNTFLVNGKKSETAKNGDLVTVVAAEALDGKQFDGWKIASGDIELKDASAAKTSFIMGDTDVELEATYRDVEYTVSFDSAGGSAVESQTVKVTANVTKPANPKREGYVFVGWQLNGKFFDFSTCIKRDIKLVAKWNKESAFIADAEVTLSKKSFTYTGKTCKPYVKSVVLGGKTLTDGLDYTVQVQAGKKVGTYQVVVTANGAAYTGKVTLTYTIKPQKVSKLKVSEAKKAFKAKWKKGKTERSGVQVRYSTNKSMKDAKTVKAKGSSVESKKVSKLKGKKNYYVQVRAYKVVDGKTYYSNWSKKKVVKTK
ncbi:MAG: InlB B-repeat-containing protein [Coriobacteriia bacterium]|nr:InlB B-repeat-containing protein [Coriobacteriia bacterium]